MKLIIANWKLNPSTTKEVRELTSRLPRKSPYEIVIAPPSLYLAWLSQTSLTLSAQNCFYELKGAYTGEVSPAQLKDLKVKYCLVGHSERRRMGETDDEVNKKTLALISQKIVPVVCIGYDTHFGQSDAEMLDVLSRQIRVACKGADSKKVVIAYEPVWSISTGDPHETKHVETPVHAEVVAQKIKKLFNPKKILYGGSVTGVTAADFLVQKTIGGLLVGGASLRVEEFNTILSSWLRIKKR